MTHIILPSTKIENISIALITIITTKKKIMMTLITKVKVLMITMITKIRITVTIIYILCEEDNAKQLYLVLKVSCRRTDNFSARYNDHRKLYSIMVSLI